MPLRLRPLIATVLAAATLAACAQPEPVTSPEPLPELAETAAPLGTDEVTLPTATGEATEPAGAVTETSPGTSAALPDASEPGADPDAPQAPSSGEAAGGSASSEPAAAAAPRVLADEPDARGDAGVEGPRWADLTRLAILTTGPDLVVVVELADTAPDALDEGDVVGIGVDLFQPGADESGYQLFVDGGSDGWHAYLQTPDGFVDYPGRFARGGTRLELTVPWTSVGDPGEAEVRAFLDWSGETLVTNLVARDDLPEQGRIRVVR